jgi:hypothetical protein
MKSTTALYQLKHMTESFLGSNVLRIAGKSTSGVTNFKFGKYSPSMTGFPQGAQKPNEYFSFDPYGMTLTETINVRVHNVRMFQKSEKGFSVDAMESYSLGGEGVEIMVTGMLSDCVFCTQGLDTSPVVAHIQPRPQEQLGAVAMHQSIIRNGKFKFHDGSIDRSYGRVQSGQHHKRYAAYSYVVGVKIGGRWRIYGQQVGGSAGPILGVTRIL